MAAMIVGAADQDALHAHLAHIAEGDLLRPHAGIKAASALSRALGRPIRTVEHHGGPLAVKNAATGAVSTNALQLMASTFCGSIARASSKELRASFKYSSVTPLLQE
jgi:hypothetical protein